MSEKEYNLNCDVCGAPIVINDLPSKYWIAVDPKCGELPVEDCNSEKIKDIKENIVGRLRYVDVK